LFKTQSHAEPVTSGIDVALVPAADAKLGTVMFADTEGSGTVSDHVDAQIFTPALLLSSAIVFSTTAKGSAQRADVLDQLASIAAMAKSLFFRVQGGGGGGGGVPPEGPPFGHLHLVFRDYNLDKRDGATHFAKLFGAGVTVAALRGEGLSEEAAAKSVATKDYVNSMFASITVHCFPHPRATAPADAPDFTFASATGRLWEAIRGQLREMGAMRLGGARGPPLTGRSGCEAAAGIGDALNAGGVVEVPSLAEAVLVAEGFAVMDKIAKPLLQHDFVQPPPSPEALAAGGGAAFDKRQADVGVTWDALKKAVEAKLGILVMPSVLEKVRAGFDEACRAQRAGVEAVFATLLEAAARKAAEAEAAAADKRIKEIEQEAKEAKLSRDKAEKATAAAVQQREASEARAVEAERKAEEARRDAERARSERSTGGVSIEQLLALLGMMGMGGGGGGGGGGMPMPMPMGSPFGGGPMENFGGSPMRSGPPLQRQGFVPSNPAFTRTNFGRGNPGGGPGARGGPGAYKKGR
jgi:hypothetical protein